MLVLVFFMLREAELRETIESFSHMLQLVTEFLKDPDDVRQLQDPHDVFHVKHFYKTHGQRFTLIRGDGIVLADGAVDAHGDMDNHLSRPEIQDALVYGRGVSMRYSDTLKAPTLYVAEPIRTNFGTLYLRLGVPRSSIKHGDATYIILAVIAVGSLITARLCNA